MANRVRREDRRGVGRGVRWEGGERGSSRRTSEENVPGPCPLSHEMGGSQKPQEELRRARGGYFSPYSPLAPSEWGLFRPKFTV